MARPHPPRIVTSCPCRASECNSLVTPSRTPVPISSSLVSPLNSESVSPSQYCEDFQYALGTLKFRKQRNRKRSKTGEYVWTDKADLVFSLALIDWTSNRSNRVGTRRANFLQGYLARNGFTKTRKQIASRLQVLKGEWRATSYMTLLDDPDGLEVSRRRRVSTPPPLTPSPTSTTSFLPSNELDSPTRSTPGKAELHDAPPSPPLSGVQDQWLPIGYFLEGRYSYSHDQQRQALPFPEPFPAVSHQLQMHAPKALVPSNLLPPPSTFQIQNSASVPGLSLQTLPAYSYMSCGPPALGAPPGGAFRQSYPFAY